MWGRKVNTAEEESVLELSTGVAGRGGHMVSKAGRPRRGNRVAKQAPRDDGISNALYHWEMVKGDSRIKSWKQTVRSKRG